MFPILKSCQLKASCAKLPLMRGLEMRDHANHRMHCGGRDLDDLRDGGEDQLAKLNNSSECCCGDSFAVYA